MKRLNKSKRAHDTKQCLIYGVVYWSKEALRDNVGVIILLGYKARVEEVFLRGGG